MFKKAIIMPYSLIRFVYKAALRACTITLAYTCHLMKWYAKPEHNAGYLIAKIMPKAGKNLTI